MIKVIICYCVICRLKLSLPIISVLSHNQKTRYQARRRRGRGTINHKYRVVIGTKTDITRISFKHQKEKTMLRAAIAFLVIAIIAAVLGFGGIAGTSAGIAKILALIFVVLFVVSFVLNGRRR